MKLPCCILKKTNRTGKRVENVDISFHYFAVKTVALAVGLSEAAAQRIAEYSQFIDDFDWGEYRFEIDEIPDYIQAGQSDIVVPGSADDRELKVAVAGTILKPVTTKMPVDLSEYTAQKYIAAPFHFIPQNKKRAEEKDRRTVPAALWDGSYISELLNELKENICNRQISENDGLMRTGMMFHTFADTYAHQLFSGYAEESNSVKLIYVLNNQTQKDETEKWTDAIEKTADKNMPPVGHAAIGAIPDLPYLSFEMEYVSSDGCICRHMRSNTSMFVTVCRELYQYLDVAYASCIRKHTMSLEELSVKLGEAFLAETSDIEKLSCHWKRIFPDYIYSYDSEKIKKRFITKSLRTKKPILVDNKEAQAVCALHTDEFYKFNLFADCLPRTLYGAQSRQ